MYSILLQFDQYLGHRSPDRRDREVRREAEARRPGGLRGHRLFPGTRYVDLGDICIANRGGGFALD